MAKKRRKKKEETVDNSKYSEIIIGIILILLGIIGIFNLGVVGKYVGYGSIFLVGRWYNFFLGLISLIGLYMLFKGEKPRYFSPKFIGLCLVVISILVLSHLSYSQYTMKDCVINTYNDVLGYIKNPSIEKTNGGIIGGLFGSVSFYLFDKKGTVIIDSILIALGLSLFTGVSIYDIITKAREKASKVVHRKSDKEEKLAITKVEDDYEDETTSDKMVITNVNELTKLGKNDSKKEEVKEENITIEDKEESEIDKVYYFPPTTLLNKPVRTNSNENNEAIKATAPLLEDVLRQFEIESKVVAAHVGPTVTQYELEVKTGTKLARILAVNREIALALAAKEVRIQAPIPGRRTVGIEIPNKKSTMVTVREVLERMPDKLKENKLAVTLGRDIMGNPQFCEINKTPHLLVAGSTGSGKSVCINSIIISILMRTRPDEVKLVLVDPKKVEFSMYNGVPHLLAPVVSDAKKANIALKKMVSEMERRYDLFEESGTKNIAGYNAYIDKKNEKLPEGEKLNRLPFIVIIIDELADLMMVAAKEVQDSIMRITQMARAAGMHLIVATQRPSTNVITGVIKANIPSRISFAVSSGIDSRTILDMIGAEKLLGHGDMLYLPQGENTPIRIQGTFISDDEIKNVVNYTVKQQKARYDETLTMSEEEMGATDGIKEVEGQDYDPGEDPLYNQVVEFVVQTKKASTSLVQRRFRIGYNRAANLIDKLEERGIVGPQNGSKPREVLVELKNEE